MPRRTKAPNTFSWEAYFAPHILMRGWDYYQEGAVTEFKAKGNEEYNAIVQGTDDYSVDIELENGTPIYMECDCPYADDGNNCKHMAAVMYAVEDYKAQNQDVEAGRIEVSREESVESIISRIPESDLRSILLELCRENDAIHSQVALRYSGKVNSTYLKKLHHDVEQICKEYSDRSGFIDWRNASGFEMEITSFLTDNTVALLTRGEPLLAFQMINDTLMRVGEQDIDDDGQLTDIPSTGYNCYSMVLMAVSPAEKESMFQWFSDHMDEKDLPDYLKETIVDFYEREFQEHAFLQKKLQRHQLSEPIPSKNDYHAFHVYEHKVKQLLNLMEKLLYPDKDIQEQIQRFYILPAARKFAVDYAVKQGKTDIAISILRGSKTIDREYPGLVREHSVRLIDLFDKEGREEEYKQELLFQIFECRQDNLNYVCNLKGKCALPEWKEYREKILIASTCTGIRLALLAAEGLDERLLECIIQSGSVYSLDSYEKTLKRRFPERVRDAYVAYVKKSMPVASSRSQYADVIRYLKKLRNYPEGKTITKQIALEWRNSYPKRRAMLDELKNAGF